MHERKKMYISPGFMKRLSQMPGIFLATFLLASCGQTADTDSPDLTNATVTTISRDSYRDQLYGFWLGQCIANWTGLVTEMYKNGGEGPHGGFYTR